MCGHLHVRREHGDQKCDQADAGEPSRARNEHPETAEDFAAAADRDEQPVCGQPRRDDSRVGCGMDEMVAAGNDKEEREQPK